MGKINPKWTPGMPTLGKWLFHTATGDTNAGVLAIREHLDDLSAEEVYKMFNFGKHEEVH